LGFCGLGFGNWGLGSIVQGLGSIVQSLVFRVQGIESRVWGLGFRIQGSGCSGFRVLKSLKYTLRVGSSARSSTYSTHLKV